MYSGVKKKKKTADTRKKENFPSFFPKREGEGVGLGGKTGKRKWG